MENQQSALDLLELLSCPGFCVKDGTIIQSNQAASQLLLGCGSELDPLLHTGRQEYAEMTGGCLYLTLQLCETIVTASVYRMTDCDLFLLEADRERPELQAYALAAQAFREPLSALMALSGSELLHSEDPKLQKQASIINRSLFQILRLVSNMSDAHRYYCSSTPILEMRDITAVLEDLFAKITAISRQADITVTFTNLRQPLYCLIDSEKLERGIYNIVSNALKYTPQGGQIRASLTRRNNQLYLRVQDCGSGIPKGQRAGIFQNFLRQPGLEAGQHGIGLGMMLICSAATAHGGTVLMENPPEGGTCITITMAIRQKTDGTVRSPRLLVDYAGEWDHALMELSEALPDSVYREDSHFI